MFALGSSDPGNRDTFVITERRSRREEGFGDVWPLLAFRENGCCRVSISPMALAGLTSGSQEDYANELIRNLRNTPSFFGVLPSLVFLPAASLPSPSLPEGISIRQIREQPPSWAEGKIPQTSIEAGTAFGVCADGEIVSWAEATPLTVTGQFGVTLVGIETHSSYRHKGYARAVLVHLTREVCERGLTPVYFCSSRNEASQKTAMAGGYSLYGEWWRIRASDIARWTNQRRMNVN